ncbi:MAG TPA: hypothetical protein PL115_01295 [Bacteroidales bacterium]|jgi:hypothetical protein|nr:MAG: hypothetical protein BWY74_03476 [Firmicutes bacterium ADurb.Bin419]HKM11853.1 hypothetical protein [Bacteroidales bacterium]HPY21750.1 hypothetical protein [Bacteroidales bacterium]HQA93163.1 hypothetical protein [Bacteroidales bacterium]HQP78480.1 hypothetical protein [Bacteroidales bacterium]
MDIKEKPASEAGSDPKGTIYNDVNKIRALFEDAESNSNGYWQKTVYKHFRKNIQFFDGGSREIDKQGDDDSYSYAFVRPINKVFDMHSSGFCKAFCQVINGKGNEINNINTLRSSALLGLLCFHSINDNNPLEITLSFNEENVNFKFNEVKFEKENRVFHHNFGKSQIDIALYGTVSRNNNVKEAVLYLESKFSEYLYKGSHQSKDKDRQYEPFYITLAKELEKCGVSYEYRTNKENEWELHVIGEQYCEGLKQMISHTIGAINSDEKGKEIYLAPILFDFGDTLDGPEKTAFSDYCDAYSKLAVGLDKLSKLKDYNDLFIKVAYKKNPTLVKNKNKLFISDKVLSYQEFFKNAKFKLPPSVKEYYNL